MNLLECDYYLNVKIVGQTRLCKVRNSGCTIVTGLEEGDSVHAELWWSQFEKNHVIPVFTGARIN